MLADLIKPKNIVVLSTNSSLAEIYVYDALKYKSNAIKDSIMQVKDKKSFATMLEKISFEPMMASKWLFEIDFKSVRALFLKYKENLERCDTAYFLVKCEKYPDFLKAKEKIACTPMYLHKLKGLDASFLFSSKLSTELQRYVCTNYGVEKCFELYNYFKDGGKSLSNKKEIQELLGTGESSVIDFVFDLMKDYKGSKRSIKLQIAKRSKDLDFLVDSYGAKSVQNFIKSDVKNLIEVKQLYLEGILYDSISKERIPEGYDFSKLSRYNIYFDTISQTPIKRMIYLLSKIIEGQWRDKDDAFKFLYAYYLSRKDDCF